MPSGHQTPLSFHGEERPCLLSFSEVAVRPLRQEEARTSGDVAKVFTS